MSEENNIQEVFFNYLRQLTFDAHTLDYSLVKKHASALQIISEIGNTGTGIFDLHKREFIFYSSNFGRLLGYTADDYKDTGQQFFASKIHPQDYITCSINGVTAYKLFHNFSNDEKYNHKLISEYRMLNVHNQYVRLVEQYQVLELDQSGQIWLMMSIVDVSPDQEGNEGSKAQLLNFRTGKIIPIEAPSKAQVDLTKREAEILSLVRAGLLSKEIAGKLSISIHTVNTHRQRLLEKLGANNSFEAVMFASKYGLLE